MPHAGTALLIVTVAAQTNPDGRKSYVVTVNGRVTGCQTSPWVAVHGGPRVPPRWSRRGWGDQAAGGAIADVLSGSPSGRLPRPPGTGWGTTCRT